MTISLITIFAAGFITILSPCILPILPAFLATSLKQSKYKPFFIALGLMFGFTAVGVLVTAFGASLGIGILTFRKIAIAILGIFGLGLLFPNQSALILGRLEYYVHSFFPRRQEALAENRPQAVSGFFIGLGLGFAWIPCVGPIFGAVLAFAASKQNVPLSVFYFLIYSLGAAIPLILLTFASNRVLNKFRWMSQKAEAVKRLAGAIMILVAISFIFNWDQKVQVWVLEFYPSFAL